LGWSTLNSFLDGRKSNRGRTKTLTDSTRKRHKKEDSAKYNKTRVSIGDEYDRWTELKDVLRIKTPSSVIFAVITISQQAHLKHSLSISDTSLPNLNSRSRLEY
jgi:hypothetical protein